MKILFDTNVVLDVLQDRKPHVVVASQLFNLLDRGKIRGALCATTLTTVHYIMAKEVGSKSAQAIVHRLLTKFEVAAVDFNVLNQALVMDFPDFEDAVLHEAGRAAGVNAIVTRNLKDFRSADLTVFGPEELLAAIVATA
jgi:predicted nucleic acid-binding protein